MTESTSQEHEDVTNELSSSVELPFRAKTEFKKPDKDPITAIKDFTLRKKPSIKEETLLPTLPNLYGLDVRFRYVEKLMKEEKDRRAIRGGANAADAEFLQEMFDHKPGVRG